MATLSVGKIVEMVFRGFVACLWNDDMPTRKGPEECSEGDASTRQVPEMRRNYVQGGVFPPATMLFYSRPPTGADFTCHIFVRSD